MGFGYHHGPDGHGHSHDRVDSSIVKSKEATRVLLISLIGLLITAIFQAIIVAISGSVALLADTIHNFGDALTSIPLWFAFMLSRKLPTKRFSYGLNRTEDLAGLIIVLVITFSALVAGYESVMRMIHGTALSHLGATAIAAIVGFVGNEIVAVYRIRMGKKMGSAALVADGHHARVDGITSLAVLVGVAGTWLGFPIVDPLVGLVITMMILFIVKDSAKAVFTRLLDGIEPKTIDTITKSAYQVEGVQKVNDVKARWFGHEILAEITITINSKISVKEGHEIVKEVIHRLQHDVEHLSKVQVHVDPVEEQGESYHEHAHFHAAHHSHGHEHDHHHDGYSHNHIGKHNDSSTSKYPFEWAGVYELSVGDYEYTLNAGPDPAMLISFSSVAAPSQEALEQAKRDAIEVFNSEKHTLTSGGAFQPGHELIQLLLEGDVTFVLRINKAGSYALFTEHHPDEFDAALRKNGAIVPILLQQAFPSAHAHAHHDHKHEHHHSHDKHHQHSSDDHKHSHHSHKHHVTK